MAKSAQQKFNEFLDESRETSQAVTALMSAGYEVYGNYAYSAGYLESLVKEVIAELPRARRAEIRSQLLKGAEKIRKELVDA